MFTSLEIFQTAHKMAQHAGARQAVTARNIANSDTPGFKARTVASFSETYRANAASTPRASRTGHLLGRNGPTNIRTTLSNEEPSPNGNSVNIETEMLNSVAISREHNRALAIYRHAMTVLRTTIGR